MPPLFNPRKFLCPGTNSSFISAGSLGDGIPDCPSGGDEIEEIIQAFKKKNREDGIDGGAPGDGLDHGISSSSSFLEESGHSGGGGGEVSSSSSSIKSGESGGGCSGGVGGPDAKAKAKTTAPTKNAAAMDNGWNVDYSDIPGYVLFALSMVAAFCQELRRYNRKKKEGEGLRTYLARRICGEQEQEEEEESDADESVGDKD